MRNCISRALRPATGSLRLNDQVQYPRHGFTEDIFGGDGFVRSSFIFLAILALYSISTSSAAQISTHIPYQELIARSQNVQTLDDQLFGDHVNLQDGSLSFVQTDVALPSNNQLHITFGRKSPSARQARGSTAFNIMGNGWEPDVPYMMGTYDSRVGWNAGGSLSRCSKGSFAPSEPYGPYPYYYTQKIKAHMWWHGVDINIPASGQEKLLNVNSQQTLPSDGKVYYGTTKSSWRVSCLESIKNGQGEGFAVALPDGTTYFFDWMAIRNAEDLVDNTSYGDGIGECNNASHCLVPLSDVFLYATKVTDRFGNTLTYSYDSAYPNRIKEIASSDGQKLTFSYGSAGQVSSVKSGNRTWSYSYTSNRLSALTLPDLSAWTFSGVPVANVGIDPNFWGDHCKMNPGALSASAPVDPSSIRTFSIKHPSGVIGEFKLRVIYHGTNNTPGGCNYFGSQEAGFWFGTYGVPSAYLVDSIIQKKFSGVGLSDRTWSYTYYPSWSFDPAHNSPVGKCGNPCATTSATTVLTNDGVLRRYTFGNGFNTNLGQLLSESIEVGGNIKRKKVYAYLTTASGQPFADNQGDIPVGTGVAYDGISHYYNYGSPAPFRNRPLVRADLIQDSATFSKIVNSFDKFVRPVTSTRSSTPGQSKAEAIAYSDNLAKWVLGQVASVKCTVSAPASTACDGDIVSQTSYDSVYALPTQAKVFGKIQQTLTYDTASSVASGQRGTLKTVKDGNNNVTTYTSWKRGIPQTTTFPTTVDQPAAVTQKAAVDDNGWITSVTDENGYKTCYGYDAMGRLTSTTFPSETQSGVCDASYWNKITNTFSQTTTAEHGLPAGHWHAFGRQGNRDFNVYYDALWRPVLIEELDRTDISNTLTQTVKRYDAAGRLAFQSFPQRGVANVSDSMPGTTTTYDALDRVTKVAQDSELGVLTTTTEYLSGSDGPYTRTKNPRNYYTWQSHFQAYDQPTYEMPGRIQQHSSGGVGYAITEIDRDSFGKPLSITRRAGNGSVSETRTYTYNANQELCRQVEPETGATLMGYDGADNLAWSAAGLPASTACNAAGNTAAILARRVDRTYDARNRLLSVVFPNHLGDITQHYTADSKLASVMADNGGTSQVTTTYGYNRRRLMTEERELWNSINWPISYVYDGNGHQSAQKWHGLTISYAPNALGQPTQVGTYATGVSYYPNGGIKQFTYGNGIVHSLVQNVRGLPDRSRDVYGSTVFLDDGYDYDQNGNVAAISDGRTGHRGDRTMTYDPLDRLTQTVSPMFGTASYAYDPLDNLIHVKLTAGNQVRDHYYCYDAKWQLTNVKAGSCSGTTVMGLGYDVQGNLANKNGQAFAFDFGNRLRTVSGGAGSYIYDGHGRRVRDFVGASKYSQYSTSGQLMQSSDGRLGVFSEYFYLQGSLLAIRERNTATNVYTVKYQHTDALGSPVVVTGQSRNFIEQREYEPYGRQLTPMPQDGPNYTGHVYDAATGMIYMQQRYYDPLLQIFYSVDPVTALSDPVNMFHRYRYANSNPYKFTDPNGRQSWCPGSSCSVVNLVKNLSNGAEAISSTADAVNQKLEKVDVRLEGAVALGVGVEGSVSLLHGDGKIGLIPVGEGADISISIQPREGLAVNFADKPVDAPVDFSGGVEVKGGAVLHGGVEAEFNPGGSVEVVPQFGVGAGEVVKYSPTINFIEWGKREPEIVNE